MSNFPADLDLTPLTKQKLTQICMGEFDLQFHFDGGWSISGAGNVEIEINKNRSNVTLNGKLNETSNLDKLIGEYVTSWKISPPNIFEVELGEKAKLCFEGSNDVHEDFVIMPKGWIIS